MLGRLILLFLLTPAVELALLIQVDRFIGFWPTVGLIIVTGIVGSHLARREGLSTWQRLNDRLQRGDLPGAELADGVIILMAGALLITPGILTDVIGFLGLIPFTRKHIRRFVMRRFQRKMEKGSMHVQFGVFGGSGPGGSDAPPNFSQGGDTPSSETNWRGRGQDLPNHADDSSTGPSADPDASSS